MIEIIFLGCGGGMPTPERNLSAMMINYSGRKILVDCGEGTQVSMKMVGRGFKTIDIICITHIHGDHIVGLPGLLSTIANSGKTDPMILIGPSGITEAVNSLMYIVPYLPFELKIIESPKEVIDLKNKDALKNMGIEFNPINLKIDTLELDHSTPCIGYNFYIERNSKFNKNKAIQNMVPKNIWSNLQNGESVNVEGKLYTKDMVSGAQRKGIKISYITDTRPIENIKSFVHCSDLLVCEGTYGKDEDIDKAIKNKHMTFREAGTIALNANVKKLMLTHFSPALTYPEEYLGNAREVFTESYTVYDRLVENMNFKTN